MSVGQSEFNAAIFDPNLDVPAGLIDPQGRNAGKRFAVYRNNVAVSLTEALKAAFPVILKLVGDDFFSAMAGVFLRQHPPSSALMMFYGEEMPEFLTNFEPAAHLGYLPDIAKFELAMRKSYHAADIPAVAPELLQSISPDELMAARFELAPALQIIRSSWPIHAIWLFNTTPDAPKPQMIAQDVLITRAEYDPIPTPLPTGGADFLSALTNGNTLGEAIAVSGQGFDLTQMLGILFGGGAITNIIKGPTL